MLRASKIIYCAATQMHKIDSWFLAGVRLSINFVLTAETLACLEGKKA
jgi:hypothetical protein